MLIPDDIRLFIKDVTLFLQKNRSNSEKASDAMFQKAYRLYVEYNVEKEMEESLNDP